MTILLVLLAILIALGAGFNLTQATLGVGLMALACLVAILARLAQAAAQHAELKRLIDQKGTGVPVAGS
jgi:hypothetical protein